MWWCLTIACAASILGFSMQSVKASIHLSGTLTDTLLQYDEEYQALPDNYQVAQNNLLHDRLRKMAHVLMFAALGFCASMLAHTYTAKRWWVIALPSCMAFAVLDECVQWLRHMGRAFEIVDIGRDWLGVLIGTAVAAIVTITMMGITAYKEK